MCNHYVSCTDTTPVVTTEPQLPTCQAGRVFNQCGTACPLTCDNRDNPPFCTRQCVAGCFCPEGTLEDNSGNCVQESQCPGINYYCSVSVHYLSCSPKKSSYSIGILGFVKYLNAMLMQYSNAVIYIAYVL